MAKLSAHGDPEKAIKIRGRSRKYSYTKLFALCEDGTVLSRFEDLEPSYTVLWKVRRKLPHSRESLIIIMDIHGYDPV